MSDCPVCHSHVGRRFSGRFRCESCGTELKLAGSTIALMIVVPTVIILAAALFLKPWIGRGGVIAIAVIVGHLLPWLIFYVFHRLEPTSTFKL